MTLYHARYFANELTRLRPADGIDRLACSLFDARVDLNPHQIDAALFAVASPISKGVILADEVGLGKTIEAGLLLCQFWAERKRRLIVLCPAALRKQWALELYEKFGLPVAILDARTHGQAREHGAGNPFDSTAAVIVVSFNFAARLHEAIYPIPWDLAVIDEAHKLRNVYKSGNVTGQRIKKALYNRRKVLLTATPLQNSLMELYGLSTLIDDHLFGDAASFRSQYAGGEADLALLKIRLSHFCKRSLRADVEEYVRYTERQTLTIPFTPTDDEHRLYEGISEFLRHTSLAVPQQQRQLTTLILRKLLASSTRAVAGTLETIRARLEERRPDPTDGPALADLLIEAEDIGDEYLDRAPDDTVPDTAPLLAEPPPLERELASIRDFLALARSITEDSKAGALLKALAIGFQQMEANDAPKKALVFTESRRTQDYLAAFLTANGFAGRIVIFNGGNTDQPSQAILDTWIRRNRGGGRVSGSRPIDMRTALVEHFRDEAQIMLATEAAAEGVNLQFCALVINYDLPWNPQRIEQRIGRCHRYGQKHDVVVINFLNQRNAADRRVLELLDEKFRLFKGVFGASDDVLGSIESGIDFEKRILAIYQGCRTEAEIDAAFSALRVEMDEAIRARMSETRLNLLVHFDEEVHARLRVHLDDAKSRLDRIGRLFWRLTRHVLADVATFDDQTLSFTLHRAPDPSIPTGTYSLALPDHEALSGTYLYRLGHPLGEWVRAEGMAHPLPPVLEHIAFDISNHPVRIAMVEELRGLHGWLSLHRVTLESFEREEFLVFSAIDRKQRPLDQETCEKLFQCEGLWRGPTKPPHPLIAGFLQEATDAAVEATLRDALSRNARHFEDEQARLEKWADDRVHTAEKELADVKNQIKVLYREVRKATVPAEQMAFQQRIRALEKDKRTHRRRIFDVEDEIMAERDRLIEDLEKRLRQRTEVDHLFTIEWSVV